MDEVHGLKVQLATALRDLAGTQEALRALSVGYQREKTRADEWYARWQQDEESLAAARRECDVLRKLAKESRQWIATGITPTAARDRFLADLATLAAPAATDEAYRCPHGRGSNESCRFCSVTGELE